MPPSIIMVIRHGEKPINDLAGVDLDGSQDPESLIVQGWQRAGALAVLFATPHSLLARPQFLYASDDSGGGSERPFETIQPLSLKLGITINDSFAKDDYADMVNNALTQNGPVLIAWEHEDIPSIANQILGNDTKVPQEWCSDRFDMIWVFTAQQSGGYSFTQVPEGVLAGDSSAPIPPTCP